MHKKALYEKVRAAIDPVIFAIEHGKLKVFLKDREKEPFKGRYELPGGLLKENETAEQALHRKLRKIIGSKIFFTQFYTFTEPKRDPRRRTISIGFIALVNYDLLKSLNNPNEQKKWHDCRNLPALAFDHKEIISKAIKHLKENINNLIVKQFLPEAFPLNKLQEAYEIIEEQKYDNRNFRKKMISSGIVEPTESLEENVSHRPAKLYRFSE